MPHAGTNYDPAMLDVARAYLDDYAPEPFPTITGMALRIGVDRERLHAWEAKYPDLAHILKKCRQQQEVVLGSAMFDKSTFSPGQIFLAKNLLGWADKLETDNTNHDTAQSLQAARHNIAKLKAVKSGKAKGKSDDSEAA